MKAIFVESENGYLAKGPKDDMMWTPSLDKKLFRLLSLAFGGIYVCSKHTYMLLPKKMLQDENRQFIVAEHAGINSLYHLNKAFPNAVLLGGPTFLKAAYNAKVIDTFIVTTVDIRIRNNSRYENPFIDVLLQADMLGEVKFEGLTVRVYKNEYKY